jgi:hydroxymethylglutaryl-CoA lyase
MVTLQEVALHIVCLHGNFWFWCALSVLSAVYSKPIRIRNFFRSGKALNMSSTVRLTEVGPRDGLQNEVHNLETADKITLIQKLVSAGITEIEVTSFVKPQSVPNLADAEDVMIGIRNLPIKRICLVANERGYERALAAGTDAVTFVVSATESHNQANINRTRDESLRFLAAMVNRAHRDGVTARLAISVAFGCPFEGAINLDAVLLLVDAMVAKGFRRIGLCDTIGIADPKQIYEWSQAILGRFRGIEYELHLHDTYGRGLANVMAGLQAGVSRFDASVGGLGGCPFAPGATGNVSTEDIVAMLDRMGVATGISVAGLLDAGDFLARKLNHKLSSNLSRLKKPCGSQQGVAI